MTIQQEIRSEAPKLLELCHRLGIAGLRVRVGNDAWSAVTFIGDINTERLEGYADRFFGLEEGLASIFHRRVRLLDEATERRQKLRRTPSPNGEASEIELLRAS